MLILFVEQCVPYEACWNTFIAACDSKETALAIARKYAVFNVRNEISKHEEYVEYKHNTADNKRRLKSLRSILKEIETSVTLSQLNEAYEKIGNDEGPFFTKEESIKSNVDEFEVAE